MGRHRTLYEKQIITLSFQVDFFLLAALLTLIGSNWRASKDDSGNSRCSSKDLNGIVSQCSLNVSTDRGQNVLLHDRNITIEVTLDQQSISFLI